MPDTTTRPWLCPQTDCPANTHDSHGAHRMGCDSGAAREARRLYLKRWKQGRNAPAFVDPLGVRRRIEACHFMGWSGPEIAERIGLDQRHIGFIRRRARNHQMLVATRTRVVPLLEALAMRRAPESFSALKTRNWARRQGFRPLLAWDDIDDPAEQAPPAPDLADQIAELAARGLNQTQVAKKLDVGEKIVRNRWPAAPTVVDPAVVDAVRAGRRVFADCREDEQDFIVATLWRERQARGESRPGNEVAALLGTDLAHVERVRQRTTKRRQREERAS